FCGHCSRIGITSDGKLRTCLFSVWDHDLYELMRRGASDEKLVEFIVKIVEKKAERHHIGEPGFVPASRTMVRVGGWVGFGWLGWWCWGWGGGWGGRFW